MVPNAHDGNQEPDHPDKQVENEKQEVSVVFQAYAVVDPGAVVVHLEHTLVADGAVVSPSWLYIIASITPLLPDSS